MIATLLVLLCSSVLSAPCIAPEPFNVITNPSFEGGAAGGSCTVPGWTVANFVAGECVFLWTALTTNYPASDLSNGFRMLGYLYGPAPTLPVTSLSQTINGLTVGKRYRLSFDMAPGDCSNAPTCAGAGKPTTASVTVAISSSDASAGSAITVSFPEPAAGATEYRPWIRKSISFTPTATSVTLSLTQPTPTTSLDFGLDNFAIEALPCATGVNLELSVLASSPTAVTDAALTLATAGDAVRVDVSKGNTYTVNDGTSYVSVAGSGGAFTCTAPATAPATSLPRGALLYTLNDVNFFTLPAAADRPFTVRGPGTLKFVINDCSDERTGNPGKNNFGAATVLIRSLPTVSCENVFGGCVTTTLPAFDGASVLTVADFEAGESLTFTTTGVWGVSTTLPPNLGSFDADGFQGVLPVGTCTPTNSLLKFGALIGSFDNFATSFLVGKGPTVVKNFGCAGTLKVRSNDCNIADNYGQLFITFCSRIATFNTDIGVCKKSVSFNAPTVTDKCPGSVVTPVGPVDVTVAASPFTQVFKAVDDQLEIAQCSVKINVVDNEAPKFTSCPANIVQFAANGVCTASVNYATPTAVDNCAGVAVVNLTPAFGAGGATFPVGTTTVTWEATAGGLKTQCTFTVKIVDNQVPTITCAAQSYCAGSFIPLGTPTTTIADNCPSPVPTVISPVGFNGLVPQGTVSVTIGATDASGNVAATPCTFSLTGVAENGGCGGTNKCIATQCVAGCIANVDLTGCSAGDNFAYQYGVNKKACTKIIRDPADFRNVIIGNTGGWNMAFADAGTEAILDTFVGTFKLTSTGFPPTVRSFVQVSGGTKSIELKTPAAITATSVCSMKFNGSDRKRAAGQLVLGGGAAPFPAI